MAHGHPLHVDLEVECTCCRSIQPFTFTSAADHVICAFCTRHLGPGKAEKREREHAELWADLFAEQAEQATDAAAHAREDAGAAAARIADLEAQVGALRGDLMREFDATASGGVRAAFETDLVRRAERATELANRRTDRVMAVLWRLAERHRDADATTCGCGEPIARCTDRRMLEPERRTVEEWERKNVALLNSGERHALPAEHPAVAGGR